MAPLKKAKIITARKEEWTRSTSGHEDLKEMAIVGNLPDEAMARWRPATGEQYLDPRDGELVVFEDFYRRGFGIPAHPFFRKLLRYYGILHIHLNPNNILHLAIFINLYEAYLGIEPHFNMFHHLFQLKSSGGAKVEGAVYLALWEGVSSYYMPVPLSTSNKGWKVKWFYTENIRVKDEEVELVKNIDAEAKANPN
jgi:hypothetical protein